MSAERRAGHGSVHGLLLAVTLAGAGTMTVELAAVRLLAPWFGTTAAVWTNVIGVVLLALSVGYLAGARLSRRGRPRARMGLALLVAGVATAALPLVAEPMARAFRPAGLALDQAADVLLLGSLATSLVLFFPAACALGCVGPLAVQAVEELRGSGAGDAGGRVLAASTLGSLAGTFATTHVAVPRLGLTATFLGAGALLVLLGLALARARGPAALAVLALAGLGFLERGGSERPAAPEGFRVLAERQSPYQSLRVVETEVEGEPLRMLQVNEGLDSFQSVWQPRSGLLPRGYYYNLFALPPWWDRPGERWRVLALGLGAGTVWRVLEGALPAGVALESVGVELDPAVVELGRRFFELSADGPDRRTLAGWDARVALETLPEAVPTQPESSTSAEAAAPLGAFGAGFDEIVLDAYANQVEIPAHLSTLEFFRAARARLAPRGWLVVNVGGFGLDDPVVDAVARTLAAAFERRTLVLRVPFSRNCVLFARRDAEPPEPGDSTWERAARGPAAELLSAMEIRGAWRWARPGDGEPLTDDHNPIEELQRRSIREAREAWAQGGS